MEIYWRDYEEGDKCCMCMEPIKGFDEVLTNAETGGCYCPVCKVIYCDLGMEPGKYYIVEQGFGMDPDRGLYLEISAELDEDQSDHGQIG